MSRPLAHLGRAANGLTVLFLASFLAVTTGCTNDASPIDEAEDTDGEDAPIESVTVPPERLTPFCQAMIDLSDRLETDPPADSSVVIVETYESVLEDVPQEIAVEFAAVLESLRSGSAATLPATSTMPAASIPGAGTEPSTESTLSEGAAIVDEGYLPDDDPAARVNAYVAFACRDSANNPGPPATAPLDDITIDDTLDDAVGAGDG